MHNSSIQSIFLAGIISFIIPFLFSRNKAVKAISILTFLTIAVYVIYQDGRAGLIGLLIAGLFVLNICTTFFKTKQRKISVVLLLFMLVAGLVFFNKSQSSAGRLHIYQLSSGILQDNWISGVGIGRFKAVFNEYQASFFSTHDINSKRALLADNTFYAFNDYLQWFIETGFPGFALLVIAIGFVWLHASVMYRQKKPKIFLTAACSGLLCIGTASLFSYSMQTGMVQFLALVFAGIILFQRSTSTPTVPYKALLAISRLLLISTGILLIYNSYTNLVRRALEKEANALSRAGFKVKAVEKYKELTESWPSQGYNQLLLAEQLYASNQPHEALQHLIRSKKYYIENKTYLLEARINNELGNHPAAEESYLKAIYMVPNRMASRYELMNFYIKRNDTANMVKWSKSILEMPVKVPSGRTDYMLRQTKELLAGMTSK